MICTEVDNSITVQSGYNAYLTKAVDIPVVSSTQQNIVGQVSATSIQAGGLATIIRIGKNGQIIINDGTNDRVLIGFQQGGF